MSDRAAIARRLAPVLFIVLLVGALLAQPGIGRWATGVEDPGAQALRDRIDALAPGALALVAFDPDLVTYPEVRPAARAVLGALRDASLRVAIVSFTPEGRALASAELARTAAQPLDIGFIPGGEAALIAAVRQLVSDAAEGPVAEAARNAGGGLGAFELAIVIGGGDIGPRSWVEQVAPRVPDLPIVAIAPSMLRPQLEPYVASGQLAALVVGPDAIAEVAGSDAAPGGAADAVGLGMLVSIVLLLWIGLWPNLAQGRGAGDELDGAAS